MSWVGGRSPRDANVTMTTIISLDWQMHKYVIVLIGSGLLFVMCMIISNVTFASLFLVAASLSLVRQGGV